MMKTSIRQEQRRVVSGMELQVVTAKLNGIDPHGYLANVLEHLPSAKSVELDTLLPWNFTTQVSTRRRNHIASTD